MRALALIVGGRRLLAEGWNRSCGPFCQISITQGSERSETLMGHHDCADIGVMLIGVIGLGQTFQDIPSSHGSAALILEIGRAVLAV